MVPVSPASTAACAALLSPPRQGARCVRSLCWRVGRERFLQHETRTTGSSTCHIPAGPRAAVTDSALVLFVRVGSCCRHTSRLPPALSQRSRVSTEVNTSQWPEKCHPWLVRQRRSRRRPFSHNGLAGVPNSDHRTALAAACAVSRCPSLHAWLSLAEISNAQTLAIRGRHDDASPLFLFCRPPANDCCSIVTRTIINSRREGAHKSGQTASVARRRIAAHDSIWRAATRPAFAGSRAFAEIRALCFFPRERCI